MQDTDTTSTVTGHAVNLGALPHRTRLSFVETVVDLVHREHITTATALDWLAKAGLTSDEHAVRDALLALELRDGLLDETKDPYEVCEATPSVHVRNLREYAVDAQERLLHDAVAALAAPADPALLRAFQRVSA